MTTTAASDAMGELAPLAHPAASIGTRKQDCLTAACAVLRSEQTLQHSAATLPSGRVGAVDRMPRPEGQSWQPAASTAITSLTANILAAEPGPAVDANTPREASRLLSELTP